MASRRIKPLALALSMAALPACNPYSNFDGEYYAGPIDPTNFAAPYVGELPGSADQSGGVITALDATAGGNPVIYYLFPFTDDQNGQDDPLAIGTDSAPVDTAYVFDPAQDSAFPATAKCKVPDKYVFDQRKEGYRLDEQGVIFTGLPDAPGYIPVVAENTVTSVSESCQDIKSAKTLNKKRTDVNVSADVNGKYDAFAIVDPGADVQPNLANGLGPIHLGWYNQYLVAFIDGGYIPTEDVPEDTQNMIPAYTRMKTQVLYVPDTIPTTKEVPDPSDPTGMATMEVTVPGPGDIGAGYDVLEFARGEAGYSPVCNVMKYTPDDPLNPPASAGDLSAAELASATDAGFVFCFQPF